MDVLPFIRRSCLLRGFNLIEAAIVLGVVGILIGGIWVAGSALNEQRHVTQTISNVLVIERNVKKLFTPQSAAGIGSLSALQAWDMGLFKGTNMTYNTASARVLDDWNVPFGASVYASGASISMLLPTAGFLSPSFCIKFVSALSSQARVELQSINVSKLPVGRIFLSFPVFPTPAQCTNVTNITIFFNW